MQHYEGRNSITLDEDFSAPEVPNNMIKLDIACGLQKREGFVGIDLSGDNDITHDLTKYPWPFEDNSVFEINCSHYAEHVVDLKSFMEECYRILMPMGIMTITGPYYSSIRATQDFTHVRSLNELTFQYFSKDWLKVAMLEHYDIKCDFENINTILIFANEWKNRADEAKMYAVKHYLNVVDDIKYILRKK